MNVLTDRQTTNARWNNLFGGVNKPCGLFRPTYTAQLMHMGLTGPLVIGWELWMRITRRTRRKLTGEHSAQHRAGHTHKPLHTPTADNITLCWMDSHDEINRLVVYKYQQHHCAWYDTATVDGSRCCIRSEDSRLLAWDWTELYVPVDI